MNVKFWLALVGVAVIVGLAVTEALLRELAGIDVSDIFRWAMMTVGSLLGLGTAQQAKTIAKTTPPK